MDAGLSSSAGTGAHVARLPGMLAKTARRLPRQDRQLLAVWRAGQISQRHLAQAMGCHHATLYRRLRRLRTRLASPAAMALTQRGKALPVLTYTVALRRHLLGHPATAIARDLSITRGRVQKALWEFAGWLSAQRLHEGEQR